MSGNGLKLGDGTTSNGATTIDKKIIAREELIRILTRLEMHARNTREQLCHLEALGSTTKAGPKLAIAGAANERGDVEVNDRQAQNDEAVKQTFLFFVANREAMKVAMNELTNHFNAEAPHQ